MYSIQPFTPDDVRPAIPAGSKRFLDELRRHMRSGDYAWKTEKTYVHWIRRFILFHNKRHPAELGAPEVEAYLSYLANDRQCSPATQRIALNALIYLYAKFLNKPLQNLDFRHAQPKQRLPVVLTHAEVQRILEHLSGHHRLMVEMLYGSGMRLNELLSLRVKDLDFELNTITVRSGKGGKDRTTLLPASLAGPLREQVAFIQKLLGHSDVKTTEIYTLVLGCGAMGVISPLDS